MISAMEVIVQIGVGFSNEVGNSLISCGLPTVD